MRDLQGIIEGLAERLGRAVAIDDAQLRLLAHTAHHEEVDTHRIHSIMTLRTTPDVIAYLRPFSIRTATEPVRVGPDKELGLLGRLCVPIRTQNTLQGFLWLIDDDESLDDDELADARSTAAAVGEVLFRNHLLDDLARAKERELLLGILSSDPHVRSQVTDEGLESVGIRPDMSCVVLVISAGDDAGGTSGSTALLFDTALRRAARTVPRVRSLVAARAVGFGFALFAFAPVEEPTARIMALGAAVRNEVLAALPSGTDLRVGVGPVQPSIADAPLSFKRALSVLDVVRAISTFPPVTSWDDLGIYQVLNQFPPDELAELAISPGLRALFAASADQWLVDTLDTYLDAAGNVQVTAKQLQIHRATLYYRLTRIEEITGASLGDGRDRLALHLGIKLARLLGELPDTGPR